MLIYEENSQIWKYYFIVAWSDGSKNYIIFIQLLIKHSKPNYTTYTYKKNFKSEKKGTNWLLYFPKKILNCCCVLNLTGMHVIYII